MSKNNIITYQTKTSTQIYLNSATADIYMNGTMKSNLVFFFEDPLQINKHAYERDYQSLTLKCLLVGI